MINKVAEALASLNSGDIEGAKLILENLLIRDEKKQSAEEWLKENCYSPNTIVWEPIKGSMMGVSLASVLERYASQQSNHKQSVEEYLHERYGIDYSDKHSLSEKRFDAYDMADFAEQYASQQSECPTCLRNSCPYNHSIKEELCSAFIFLPRQSEYSDARANICKQNGHWRDCATWLDDKRCLKSCDLHKQ